MAKKRPSTQIELVPFSSIVTNKFNPDQNRLGELNKKGYVFFPQEGYSKSKTLYYMAMSNDMKLQKQFTELIEQHENDNIVLFSLNLYQTGMLNPIGLQPAEEAHTYHLIQGFRRFVAMLYYRIKNGEEIGSIESRVQKINDSNAFFQAISENVQRREMHALAEANSIWHLHNNMDCSIDDIASRLGMSTGTVRNRLKIVQAPDNIKELYCKNQITLGQLQDKTEDIVNGGDGDISNESGTSNRARGGKKRNSTLSYVKVLAIFDEYYSEYLEDDDEESKEAYAVFFDVLIKILQFDSFEAAQEDYNKRQAG